jgi:hypothetical protein
MNHAGFFLALSFGLLVGSAALADQQQSSQSQSKWPGPLPDLNTVEECQKADLSRHWGSTFRFHRDGCWANVSFDDEGRVTAFEPDEPEICKKVLATCVGWPVLD